VAAGRRQRQWIFRDHARKKKVGHEPIRVRARTARGAGYVQWNRKMFEDFYELWRGINYTCI
jgi:hypothetical protein